MSEGGTPPKKPVKSTGTVFDVKRPGRTPLQPTSRPIIVGHKSMVRDPFTTGKVEHTREKKIIPDIQTPSHVAPKLPAAESSPEPASSDSAATPELAAVVAELSTPAPKSPEPAPSPAPLAEKPAEAKEDEDAEWIKPEDATKEEEKPKDYVPASTAPIIPPEPVAKQTPISPELRKKMEDEVKNNPTAPEPEGVVVAGEHAPINFAKVFLWFVSVILLVIIVGDALLDAGVISTSVNIPHTHLIKK